MISTFRDQRSKRIKTVRIALPLEIWVPVSRDFKTLHARVSKGRVDGCGRRFRPEKPAIFKHKSSVAQAN